MATTLDKQATNTRRWSILAFVLTTTWGGTLLNSMMPISLPSMLDDLNISLNLGVFIISVYTLFFAVLNPVFGWLGDRYGYRRIYAYGVVGLLLSSCAAAISPFYSWLILTRLLQGVFSAMTLPAILGIISATFLSHHRGVALGIWGAVNGAGHGLGPIISGFLVQNFSWRATFWFVALIFLVSALFVSFIPKDRGNTVRPFDWIGATTFTLAILILMAFLTLGSDLGWTSLISLAFVGVSTTLMIVFIFNERKTPFPFIEYQLLANRRYTTVTAVMGIHFFCLMGLQLLISLYLIELLGLAAGLAGLLIAPLAITLAMISPIAGRVTDRFGFRVAIVGGLTVVMLSVGSMILWTAATPLWILVPTLIIVGLGMGFIQSPSVTGVTLSVRKEELGVAMGLFSMFRFLGGTLGATVIGIILGSQFGGSLMESFDISFYLLTILLVIALLLAIKMPRPEIIATPTAAK